MKQFSASSLRKRIGILLVMLMVLSLPVSLSAQKNGGILKDYDNSQKDPSLGMMNRGSVLVGKPKTNVGNQPFGVDPTPYAPLGSGAVLLVVAGVGYALVKSRKSEK